MRFWNFLILLLVVNQLQLFSQDSIPVKENKYIQNYQSKFTIQSGFLYNYNNLGLFDKFGRTIKYIPNNKFSLGLGINAKYFAFKCSLYSFGNLNEERFGKTQKFDLQVHIYLKRFITDFVYQDYKGFYIDTLLKKAGDTLINTHRTYLMPSMTQQSIGSSIMFFTNHKNYSFKSTFCQTEFQKKSAGAWAFGLSFHYLSLNSPDGLVHDSLKGFIDTSAYYKHITSFNAGVLGGYFHTFTLRKWYTTIATLIGFDGKIGEYSLEDGEVLSDTNYAAMRMQVRFGTGFNTKHFYYGAYVIGDGYLFNNSFQQYGTIKFFMGYRFLKREKKR
jgi:hypothetical protein